MDDLQMAIPRGGDPHRNFAVGEPHLLGQITTALMAERYGYENPVWSPRYPSLGGEEPLIEAIQASPWTNGQYVVVTNGAKQGLSAALYALNRFYREAGTSFYDLALPHPYWPSFPTIASEHGLSLIHSPDDNRCITAVVAPNNPDGRQKYALPDDLDLWDAAYACPAYGWNGVKLKAKITVHTASKLFGLSGLRVGWISTDIMPLAALAAEYVEMRTSGVDRIAQYYLMCVLRMFAKDPSSLRKMHWGFRRQIMHNQDHFMEYLSPFCDDVLSPIITEGEHSGGMFAFFKPRDEQKFDLAVRKARINVVQGYACGMPGYKRITLGNSRQVTRDTFKQLTATIASL